MYKVIGTDDREYGPVSAQEIQTWIQQKRLHARSRVQPVGSSEWKLLGDLPEFSAALAATNPPLPLPPLTSPYGAPRPAGPKTSALAIVSLVLGALGLFTLGVTGLFGLVCGIVALVRIQRRPQELGGSGVAIAGICVSGVMLLILPVMAALLLPALAKAKTRAQTIQCMNNVRQLNLALVMYATDYGQLPASDKWCDLIMPYTGGSRTPFHCASEPPGRCSYMLNTNLFNVPWTNISSPQQVVLVFSSADGWNQGGSASELKAHKHASTVVVGFADGHAEVVNTRRANALVWHPRGGN